ncbi:MAG TPA: NAD(P)-binding domain-containing protein [Nitrososphaerales archaeon]|nr:NAD(P)-binding domain-containing protein [Nitrososphaerales archaeon]
MKSNVGIIGRGNVGSALKRGLEKAGYPVKAVGNDARAVEDTAKWAEIIILAVPFVSIDKVLSEMGKWVDGKILVDATNVYTPEAQTAVGNKSGAEIIQTKASEAKVVKAFNIHFAKNMDSGHIGQEQITLLVSGEDEGARAKILEIGRDIGFDAIDAGPLANSKLLEALGNLTIQLGYPLGLGTSVGFKLVH